MKTGNYTGCRFILNPKVLIVAFYFYITVTRVSLLFLYVIYTCRFYLKQSDVLLLRIF